MRFSWRQYVLIFSSFLLLGIAYTSIRGIQIAPDTGTYSQWADILIRNHFHYPSYLSDVSFKTPAILYIGWVTVVALFKLALSSQWVVGLVVFNIVLFAAIGTALISIVGLLSDTKLPVLLAGLMYATSFHLLQWVSFVLSDISFLALTFTPLFIYVLFLNRRRHHISFVLGILAILALAVSYRPASIPLLATFAIGTIATIQTKAATPESRARYSRLLFSFTMIGVIIILLLGSLLAQNPNLWPFDFARGEVDFTSQNYNKGIVIHGRPETFHQPPVALIDYIAITLDKFIHYFSPTAEGFSFIHKVYSILFYIPIYLLAGFGVLFLFLKDGYRRTSTWLVALTASLFVLFFASYHAVLTIDFDWRYRVPCIPVLILLAALGVNRIIAVNRLQQFVHAPQETIAKATINPDAGLLTISR